MALKRRRASSARLTLASSSRPVEAISRPRPHTTLPLQMGVGLGPPPRPRLVESTGAGNLAAEAARHLLIEDGRGAADRPLVDDKAHRIGADVDHPDRLHGPSGPPGAPPPQPAL